MVPVAGSDERSRHAWHEDLMVSSAAQAPVRYGGPLSRGAARTWTPARKDEADRMAPGVTPPARTTERDSCAAGPAGAARIEQIRGACPVVPGCLALHIRPTASG